MACEAEVSGVFAEADQECFAPGGGVVDVIIVQVLHFFSACIFLMVAWVKT